MESSRPIARRYAAPMSGSEADERARGPERSLGLAFTERFVLPYVRDPGLWPVLLVIIGHLVLALALLLLLAARDGHTAAWVLLGFCAAGSVAIARFEWRRLGLGALSGIILASWLLGAVLALVADHHDLY